VKLGGLKEKFYGGPRLSLDRDEGGEKVGKDPIDRIFFVKADGQSDHLHKNLAADDADQN
jgi:hypothetical protein